MNKLIELLNVYWKEKYPKSKLRYYKYDSLNHEFLSNCIPNDSEEKVLGRRFGFIQRLVKNNRIDIERLHKIVDYRLEIKENYVNAHDYNSDCLLMLLAISDTPIDFLISVLK